jgi:hypothetical protein
MYRAMAPTPNFEAFEQGLRERGWVEGQNIIIERRYDEGRAEQFPDLAADLVRSSWVRGLFLIRSITSTTWGQRRGQR